MKYNRIVIIEPALRDFHGHYFNVAALLAEECRRRGLAHLILANHMIRPEVAAALPSQPIPHFQLGTYFDTSQDPVSGPIESYLDVNLTFVADLFRLSPNIRPDDLLIVPTAGERLTAAFAGWLDQLEASARPRCVLSYSFDPQGLDNEQEIHTLRMLYRAGFNAVRRSRGRHWITLLSNSAIDEYSRLAERPVAQVPIAQPAKFAVDSFSQNKRQGGQVVVTYLGAAAARKGFDLLPEIIEQALSARQDLRFIIQVYGYGKNDRPMDEFAPTTQRLEELAEKHPQMVTLRPGSLSLFEFYALLGASDVILTAYSPAYDQISGVLNEAIAFGKAMIVRSGSATERAASLHGAAVACSDEFSAPGIASAILSAAANIDTLLVQAGKAAAQWHTTAGTGPYLDEILRQCAVDDTNLPVPAPEDAPTNDIVTGLAHGDIVGLMSELRSSLKRFSMMGSGGTSIPWNVINQMSRTISLYHEKTHLLQEEIALYKRSQSWRITRPLRYLRRRWPR